MSDNESHPVDPAARGAFDTSDLDFFHELVDDILAELRGEDYLFEASPRGELRLQLAAAVFRCAESGERDYDGLRRRVLDQFLMPASLRRTGST